MLEIIERYWWQIALVACHLFIGLGYWLDIFLFQYRSPRTWQRIKASDKRLLRIFLALGVFLSLLDAYHHFIQWNFHRKYKKSQRGKTKL